MRSVWPSGADLATRSAPIWPLAPGRFSTIAGCAQIEASFGSMMRASVSAPPPGGNGTTMRIGFVEMEPRCVSASKEKPARGPSPTREAEPRRRASSASPPLARPEHALLACPDRADAFIDEFLHALAFVGLGRVQVTLGIGSDAVHAIELSGLAPAVAEVRDLLQRIAHDDAHLLVLAVGEEDEPLLAILRERDVPGRARGERLFGVERFLHELAVRLEYLHAVG